MSPSSLWVDHELSRMEVEPGKLEEQTRLDAHTSLDDEHLFAAFVMLRAIDASLSDLLGPSTARALNFYVNPETAPLTPLQYEASLGLLLGPISEAVVRRLREKMCELSRVKPSLTCTGIEKCLECITRNYVGKQFPLGPQPFG